MNTLSKEIKGKFEEFLKKGEAPYNYERILLEKHWARISCILEGGNPPPYELEIQTSPYCNVSCSHCIGRECGRLKGSIGKFEIDRLEEMIDDFEDGSLFRIETIKFCGLTGEPLTNPYTAYALEKFSRKNKEVKLFTNGMGLENIDYSGRSNLESILCIDHLNLSLDAGCDETLKAIKGPRADYNTIFRGVRGLAERRKGRKPEIAISFVIGKNNYGDIERATYDAKKVGADIVRFKINIMDRLDDGLSLKIIEHLGRAKELEDSKFKVISIHSEEEIKGEKPEIFGEKDSVSCYTSALWGCVGSDFQFYPCGHSCHPGAKPYGNLYVNTLNEIWNSDCRKDLRKCLPGEGCFVCSPFSLRANEFLTYLSKLPNGTVHELWS